MKGRFYGFLNGGHFSTCDCQGWIFVPVLLPMNLPNSITLARLALTVVYVIAASLPGSLAAWLTLVSFCVAAATDWLDGYLARKLNLVTALGKLLDPLVDKILVCSAFVHLSLVHLCPMWLTILIIGREFLVTGLRQLAVEQGIVIAADRWGKLKTIFQIVFVISALVWLVLEKSPQAPHILGLLRTLSNPALGFTPAMMWIALFLTLLSGVNYLRASASLFREQKS
jgi:CDP-diacylglycerol--glycerol-3-phosphate 3-phosphatidyltransferase